MGDPVKLSPAATTQTLPKPGVSQQQTLERFNTAVQTLHARIQANPAVLENLRSDVHGAEFLQALTRIAGQGGSSADIGELQGFLADLPGMEKVDIGPMDQKIGTKLTNALNGAWGPLSKYNADTPTPFKPPVNVGTYPTSTQVGNPVQTPFPSPLKPPNFDERWNGVPPSNNPFTLPGSNPFTLPGADPFAFPGLGPVQPTAPVAAKPPADRKAEATAMIADIAKAITPSGGEGGLCFRGVKKILSQTDDVARLALVDPAVLKTPRNKDNAAKWAQLPAEVKALAGRLKTNKGLAAAVEKLRKDPELAQMLTKSQLLFPPDAGHAYQASTTFDAPDSPYTLHGEGKHGDLKPGDLSDPAKFPKGAIIVWDKSPRPTEIRTQIQAITKGRKDVKLSKTELAQVRKLRNELARVEAKGPGIRSGHIAVIGGDGKEYSDRAYNFRPHYGEGNYKVYVLK